MNEWMDGWSQQCNRQHAYTVHSSLNQCNECHKKSNNKLWVECSIKRVAKWKLDGDL